MSLDVPQGYWLAHRSHKVATHSKKLILQKDITYQIEDTMHPLSQGKITLPKVITFSMCSENWQS